MPSFYIHERVALTEIRPECDSRALALGAYGPDSLYFAGSGDVRALGKLLHSRRTGEFLCDLIRVCADDAACRDYARGFLSHYAVDVAFHPMVYGLSVNDLGYSTLKHLSIEHTLDAWLMGIHRVPRTPAPGEGVLGEIYARLGAAIMLWQPDADVDASDLKHALKRSMSVNSALGLFSGEGGTLHVENVQGEGYIEPEQLQQLALGGWRNPWTGIISHDGPYELLGTSMKRTGELCKAADSFWHGDTDEDTLKSVIGDDSYLSGLNWRLYPPLEPVEIERVKAVKRVFAKGDEGNGSFFEKKEAKKL